MLSRCLSLPVGFFVTWTRTSQTLFRLDFDASKHIIKSVEDTFVDMFECGRTSLPLCMYFDIDVFGRLLDAASFGA